MVILQGKPPATLVAACAASKPSAGCGWSSPTNVHRRIQAFPVEDELSTLRANGNYRPLPAQTHVERCPWKFLEWWRNAAFDHNVPFAYSGPRKKLPNAHGWHQKAVVWNTNFASAWCLPERLLTQAPSGCSWRLI